MISRMYGGIAAGICSKKAETSARSAKLYAKCHNLSILDPTLQGFFV
jgi:hypothetical protein